ncbi:MAG TPA: PilZ domain-containing protein [Terriglobales bacterium]|nr:PilZ domain-containing protein [Terriglobales bacterium]
MDNAAGRRKHKRLKMVLPVRVWSKGASDEAPYELAHTLDITPRGARLAAIHHELKPGDRLMVQYRQRKIQFRVIWIRPMEGTSEYQVGVEALESGETWGLELTDNTSANASAELVNS